MRSARPARVTIPSHAAPARRRGGHRPQPEPPIPFARPVPPATTLARLADRAGRLASYAPPFAFTSFFAPEDTLLCLLAADAAIARLPPGPRIVELTAGSGLVGLALLEHDPGATLLGVDLDPAAVPVARANAGRLGLGARARFVHMSLWDERMAGVLAEERVGLLVCNPPYVPEPPDGRLPIEAGSGPDGAAHVDHVLELAAATRPAALVLSWCSLCDPDGVVDRARRAGYALDALYVCAIADGEYSGMVRDYLRTLPTAFLSESAETVAALASDGAARFGYLLLAGVFREAGDGQREGDGAAAVRALVRRFASEGLRALERVDAPFAVETFILDRWDEIALRAALHGDVRASHLPLPASLP